MVDLKYKIKITSCGPSNKVTIPVAIMRLMNFSTGDNMVMHADSDTGVVTLTKTNDTETATDEQN